MQKSAGITPEKTGSRHPGQAELDASAPPPLPPVEPASAFAPPVPVLPPVLLPPVPGEPPVALPPVPSLPPAPPRLLGVLGRSLLRQLARATVKASATSAPLLVVDMGAPSGATEGLCEGYLA